MNVMLALVDCTSFYVSCEKAFNVALREKPVLVLTNNDACIAALSKEAKALGFQRGTPLFQCRDLIEQHQVVLLSSNYSLYHDMSARVMANLAAFSPHPLARLCTFPTYYQTAKENRSRVERGTKTTSGSVGDVGKVSWPHRCRLTRASTS